MATIELPVRRTSVGHGGSALSRAVSDLSRMGHDMLRSRELLYQLTRRDVTIRYKQAVMGFGWALFMPLLIVFSGLMVQLALANFSGRALSPAGLGGMAIKAVPWSFFVGAIGFATSSLVANMNIVTKVSFPRAVLPLSAVGAQCFDSGIAFIALAILLPVIGAVEATWALLWVPLLLVLLLTFTTACALLLSCANLFFRDVKYIVQVLLTFGIFFTPVFFEPAMLGPRGATIAMLNPMSPLLEGLRLSVTLGHNLLEPLTTTMASGAVVTVWSPLYLLYAVVITVVGLPATVILFQRSQYAFAEYI
ncbi:MAG: ABC transporter permease [Gemmatimonadaceae bacterium]|nr:ABC transporter permease [Gemmatimonadaceae bacterium]